MLLSLGPTLQMTRGFAAAEVERAYARARELSEELGEPVELFQALWGLWLHTAGRGRQDRARPFAEELLALAERLGDPALLLEAHHAMCPSTLWSGDPDATRQHGEKGMALYDQETHASLAFLYGGHDPGVCCRMHSGMALWFLGYPKSALERSRSGLALARDLSHLGSIVNALPFAMLVHQLRGDGAVVRELMESIITLSTEHGFPQWLLFGKMFEAWFQAEQEGGEAAIAQLRGAIAEYRATGNELYVPGFFSLLATALLKHGAADEALGVVADAQAMVEATGMRLWDSDYSRLKGELLLARDPAAEQDAEIAFRQAIGSPAGRARNHGSCARRSPWPGCGRARASARRRPGCSRRSMAGSPKASIPPTSWRRRACSIDCPSPRPELGIHRLAPRSERVKEAPRGIFAWWRSISMRSSAEL